MNLIDTHCHLAHGRLRPDAPAAIARAAAAGVQRILVAAADIHEAKAALGLCRDHASLSCMAGVHPHEAKDFSPGALQTLEDLARASENVAIGEIGLDYHYDFSPREQQRNAFAAQLALAVRLGKPVVVHTREAFDDTMAILRDSGVDGSRVEFHSFTEGPDAGRTVLDFGAMIGMSGIVTFARASDVQATAVLTPDDRLLVETDAPYLSPEPVRKMKTNEPANVAHTARFLAALRRTDPDDLAARTTANAERFFGLLCG